MTRSLTIATGPGGEATVPSTTVIKAGTTVGTFWLTISATEHHQQDDPVRRAVRVGLRLATSAPDDDLPTGTTPVKIAALVSNGAKVSDAEGHAHRGGPVPDPVATGPRDVSWTGDANSP